MSEHQHTQVFERHCDVAVIGGSAAGLAAALQLVRQRRSVVVVDSGTPRNAAAAHMHAYLGYEGAAPSELMNKGREEVRSYGGEILSGTASHVERAGKRFRVVVGEGNALLARRVVVATGLVDDLPAIEGLAEHWGDSVISCPFCHGYEIRDRRIVHIVTSTTALHTVPLYCLLAGSYTVVLHEAVGSSESAQLRSDGFDVREARVARVMNDGERRLCGVQVQNGEIIDADAVVVSPSFHVRTEAVQHLGLEMSEHPSGLGSVVKVDLMGATSVFGVYAAGNVTDPTLQVLPAAAHGSRVGAAVAIGLAAEDVSDLEQTSDWDYFYSGDVVWSGNPNGTLAHEVSGMVPGRALDVGAGEGGDAIWLTEQGWQVTATDVSSRALERVTTRANERGLAVECLHRDASTLDAFPREAFDLVSLQYGAIPRSPDQRGVRNVIDAVAPGGTLLVVGHDPEPMRDTAHQVRMWDPEGFSGVDEFVAVLKQLPGWSIECFEKRPRPAGAASSHHVDDIVLRSRRR